MSTTLNLGKKPNENSGPIGATPSKTPKVYYPTLYLSDIKDLDKIPEEGTATIKFKRVSLTKSDRTGQKPSVSCDLEVQSITFEDAGADEEGDIADGMKGTAKKMGLDLGDEAGESPEEEASETPDEEATEDEEE